MWAGVVPQQPPTRFTQPSSTKRCILSARLSGVSLVLAALVGQARVRIHAHEARGDRRERAQVVGHELGAGGAVEPDREEIEVLERDVERLDALAGQHGAHRLDGAAHHQRQRRRRPRRMRLAHADGGRLDVERVLAASRAAARPRRPRSARAPGRRSPSRTSSKVTLAVTVIDRVEGPMAPMAKRAARR